MTDKDTLKEAYQFARKASAESPAPALGSGGPDLTAPEAVERFAREIAALASREAQTMPPGWPDAYDLYDNTADTLRALSTALEAEKARAEAAETERDSLKAELDEAVGVLNNLVKEAAITDKRGAVTGSYWTYLGMSILKARAFLARHQKGTP